MKKIIMKKDNSRTFKIVSEDEETITLQEGDKKPKSLKKSTFKKSYKVEDTVAIGGEDETPSPIQEATTDMLPYVMQEDDGEIEVLHGYGKPQTIGSWDMIGVVSREHGEERAKLIKEQTQNSMRANRDAKSGDIKPFMPNPYFLRQSMVTSYLQCPDKMYDSYENGYNEDTIFTKTGTAIHGVMEDFYNDKEAMKLTGYDLEEHVIGLFEKWWASHSTPEWDWYRDWKQMTVDYFLRKEGEQPDIIAIELEYRVEINGVPVSGTIDRIDRVDANTIKIVDYKTNFRPWSNQELSESIQFQIYTLACMELKDQLGEFTKVECTYDMLRLGYEQKTSFNEETLAIFADWLKMMWNKILEGRDRAPQLNKYCSFCQKRQQCSKYIGQLSANCIYYNRKCADC